MVQKGEIKPPSGYVPIVKKKDGTPKEPKTRGKKSKTEFAQEMDDMENGGLVPGTPPPILEAIIDTDQVLNPLLDIGPL